MVHFILSRLQDPSTNPGLSGIALALGLSGEPYNVVNAPTACLCGLGGGVPA